MTLSITPYERLVIRSCVKKEGQLDRCFKLSGASL